MLLTPENFEAEKEEIAALAAAGRIEDVKKRRSAADDVDAAGGQRPSTRNRGGSHGAWSWGGFHHKTVILLIRIIINRQFELLSVYLKPWGRP